MADAKNVLRALLAKVFKMQDGDMDTILQESTPDQEAIDNLLDKDKTRVSELSKAKPGQTFQDGYAKGKKEVLTNLETQLRADYEVEDEVKAETTAELITAIVEKATKAKGPAKLDDEAIKKSPVYQALEKQHKKALAEVNTEWQKKYDEQAANQKKADTGRTISTKAMEVLNSLNPVVPGNAKIAANMQNAFLASITAGAEFEINEAGQIVMMKEGKVLTDAHGHTLAFEDFVKSTAPDFYEFKQNNGGGNAGNGQPGSGGQPGAGAGQQQQTGAYPAGVQKPKTLDELTAIMNNSDIKPEDRQVVLTTFQQENPGL